MALWGGGTGGGRAHGCGLHRASCRRGNAGGWIPQVGTVGRGQQLRWWATEVLNRGRGIDTRGLTKPRGWLPRVGSGGVQVIQRFTSSHGPRQTNWLFVYTGTALPDPAVVVVKGRSLPHFLKDLLSLQLCSRRDWLLLVAPLGGASVPTAV